MGKPVHVVPLDGRWAVKRDGRETPISPHGKQKTAIDTAVDVAKPEKAEVIIHGRDGKIRARETYRPDPFLPRDKEH